MYVQIYVYVKLSRTKQKSHQKKIRYKTIAVPLIIEQM